MAARALRKIRRDSELTQTDIAERAEMQLSRYFRIEHGIGRAPTVDERIAVAAALNVPVQQIAFAHDERHK